MCFHFFYTVKVDTIYQKVLYNSCLFLFLRHGIQKTKEHILHKWGFIVFYPIKSYWFDFIHYTEIIFLSKNVIFLYILKIFFTMLHLKILLEYWIILYIFRISLRVTGPLHTTTFWKYTKLYNILKIFSSVTW